MPIRGGPAVLLGLIGAGIQASRAPALHEGEASEHGLRCIYRLIDLERLGLAVDLLDELVTAAERMGFVGLNITHPCKQAVMPLLTELSGDAAAIGAVNTVLLRDGRRIGHNTDWWGFAESFRRGLPRVALHRVGTNRRRWCRCRSRVRRRKTWRRTPDNLRHRSSPGSIADRTDERTLWCGAGGRWCRHRGVDGRGDGMINATPIGMVGHPGLPISPKLLTPTHWVAEVIYFPLETELLVRLGSRDAGVWMVVAWQCSRRSRPFVCSPVLPETRAECCSTLRQ